MTPYWFSAIAHTLSLSEEDLALFLSLVIYPLERNHRQCLVKQARVLVFLWCGRESNHEAPKLLFVVVGGWRAGNDWEVA